MPKKTAEQLFLAWCAQARIKPKSRPVSNFDIGPASSGREYVLDPWVKLLAGRKELKLNKRGAPYLLVRFKEDGQWAGGSMMLWGKNPWERVK